ncbi:MAG: nucleotidyltransferase domain-containing protein [Candidatus Eremiobacterota bacterium]
MDLPLDVFRQHGVHLAYLFGSRAHGRDQPESDLDVAVLFPRATTPLERLDRAGRLQAELKAATALSVDLVVLNDAGPALSFEAAVRGQPLLGTPEERFRFEQVVRSRYEDLIHSQRFFTEARRRRLGLTP